MINVTFKHLYHFNLAQNRTVPNHFHDCYEFCYYLEGSGGTEFLGKSLSYSAMQYAVYEPGVVHNESHSSDTSVLCLTFNVSHEEDLAIHSGVYADIDTLILEQFNRIRQEFTEKQPGYKVMLELIISQLIILYDRQQNKQKIQQDDISRIRSFIDVNFANDISFEDLAKTSGYSYHHFRHIFKQRVGYSPKNYAIRKRVEYAQSMLVHKDISISEIVQMSGFSTSSQFSSIFKKYTGMSPTQFRLQK